MSSSRQRHTRKRVLYRTVCIGRVQGVKQLDLAAFSSIVILIGRLIGICFLAFIDWKMGEREGRRHAAKVVVNGT